MIDNLKNLCTPAKIYFIFSMIGIFLSIFQNFGNKKIYKLGKLAAQVSSIFLVFAIKFLYIIFWTWILNLICKDGHIGIAWFLVLVPFIFLFGIMSIFALNPHMIEKMSKMTKKTR